MVWKEEEIGCIFCVWTWEVQYFLFYAVLNKAHAFFADPKESRIYWDKTRKKKSENREPFSFDAETQNWQVRANRTLHKENVAPGLFSFVQKKKKRKKKGTFPWFGFVLLKSVCVF